jgi:ABC-type multidrug transport system fused ATPase/permease subunit
MEHYLKVFRFGWPFLKRYRGRFFAGVLTGFLFAASNGLFVGVVTTLTERITPRPAITQTTVEPREKSEGRLHDLKAWLKEQSQPWVDTWLPRRDQPISPTQLVGGILLLPLLAFIRGGLRYLSSYCIEWVSARAVLDIQSQVLQRLSCMSLGYFNSSRLGDHILRIQTDTGVLQKTLNLGVSDLIKEPATVIVLIAALFVLNWQMCLLALFFFPFYGWIITKVGRKTRTLAEKNLKPTIAQGSQLIEYLANIRLVKAYQLEDFQLARFLKNGREQIRYLIKRVQAQQLLNPAIETLAFLGLGLTILYVIWARVEIQDLAGFIVALVGILNPVKKIAGLHVTFKNASVSVDRVADALTMQPDIIEPTQPVSKPSFDRAISFHAVSFAYGDTPVLRDLTLEIPKGIKLGIVGESGSGKSTLINLLMRFYDPQSGRIEIDGIPLSRIATSDLRRLMALVSQEVAIFDMTVAENIALGRQDACRADIEEAARRADAHSFITALPQGYDTRVGENGATLSGGQRQRIAIARALIRNSPILLLDEATAALDSKSEAEVQATLDRLSENYTIIAVAHRLSSLRNFDRILVMENGRVVEAGSFPELIARGGLFATMAARQGLTA